MVLDHLNNGLWALSAASSYYRSLPGTSDQSSLDPVSVIVRDLGIARLTLAVLLIAAAVLLERHILLVALGVASSGPNCRSGRETRCLQLVAHRWGSAETDPRVVEIRSSPQEEEEYGRLGLEHRVARASTRGRQQPSLIEVHGSQLKSLGEAWCSPESDLPRVEILDNLADAQTSEILREGRCRAHGELGVPAMYGSL